MGEPYHVARPTSRLLSLDRASSKFQALALIAESLAHPQRTLLSAFVQNAADQELASRFFLQEVLGQNKAALSEFLADWIRLLRKVSPIICEDIEGSLERSVWERDGGKCCISRAHEGNNGRTPLLVRIMPPLVLCDDGTTQDQRLHKLLAVYIGESQSKYVSSCFAHDLNSSDHNLSQQFMLLSPRMFDHFKNGRLSFRSFPSETTENSAFFCIVTNKFLPCTEVDVPFPVTLENRAPDLSRLPATQLLNIHHQFALALAWLEVSDYMSHVCDSLQESAGSTKGVRTKGSIQHCIHSASRIFRYIWMRMPVRVRAVAYKHLATISQQLYKQTGAGRNYRLPFNLYLRKAGRDWAPKHQAELQSLQIVEKYTRIPAPRGIDVVQDHNSSFLLMTGLPGQIIGPMLHTMTDKHIDAVRQDLEGYIAELRDIPHKIDSEYQICNALGDGILDWRISDSQREELKFQTEGDFNRFLTFDLPLDEDAWKQISRSHGIQHKIVFTHADLSLRNILVDESGKISGIVDWECAGWYPEYWEYSKMHFAVRFTTRWIVDVIDQIFKGYEDELKVENMLSSMASPW